MALHCILNTIVDLPMTYFSFQVADYEKAAEDKAG